MASSKLVPTINYVKMHEFLYELKPKLPKVLIFPSDKGTPSWIKMVASSYKRTTEEEVNTYKQGKVTERAIPPPCLIVIPAQGIHDRASYTNHEVMPLVA